MRYLIAYAFQFVGTPYKWGGSTHDGIDCSGLVQEILMSVGADPSGDQTAQGLYDAFKMCPSAFGPGALCFYGKSLKEINHIAFMIDSKRIIEAGGGGSQTITRADAERDMAFVRVRPYDRRNDFLIAVMPAYPKWVLND